MFLIIGLRSLTNPLLYTTLFINEAGKIPTTLYAVMKQPLPEVKYLLKESRNIALAAAINITHFLYFSFCQEVLLYVYRYLYLVYTWKKIMNNILNFMIKPCSIFIKIICFIV